jgi:hypothetical protein
MKYVICFQHGSSPFNLGTYYHAENAVSILECLAEIYRENVRGCMFKIVSPTGETLLRYGVM